MSYQPSRIDYKHMRIVATIDTRVHVERLRTIIFKHENAALDLGFGKLAQEFLHAGIQIDSIAYKRWPDWLSFKLPKRKQDA